MKALLTGFLGRLLLLFIGLYIYEKAIQKWDPLLRMPWLWGAENTKYQQALRRQKAKRAIPKYLKVVK